MEAGITAQIAMTQQAVALSVLKQSADMQQKMADILMESIVNVPTGGRGGLVNMTA
ncbi:MAG: hypothetical protein KKA05_08430 [Alphaproteobacteria bacterium]|nr:hypothetical protein [Alphaproteobacteria bacterium]